MSNVFILGSGPIGATTARRYAAAGHQVTVVTRSGTGPTEAAIKRVAMSATGPAFLALSASADVIINAINLPYGQWQQGWPPVHQAVMAAAESSGAVLCLVGNLYGYAPGTSPMTPGLPLEPSTRKGRVRAQMWQALREAHQTGQVRGFEVRASDYVGPQVTTTMGAHAGPRLVDPVLGGKRAWVVGDPDAPHSWTAVDDIAETIVTLAEDERAWGRAWHVPSVEPRSIRQVANDYARAAGVAPARVSRIPRSLLRGVGIVSPTMREMVEMLYQFDAPFVADLVETTTVFGVEPTPWQQTIDSIVGARGTAALAGTSR